MYICMYVCMHVFAALFMLIDVFMVHHLDGHIISPVVRNAGWRVCVSCRAASHAAQQLHYVTSVLI